MKLKAVANYAGKNSKDCHRIEPLAEIDNRLKVLDMNLKAAREVILGGKRIERAVIN